jgi:hypothetical protein
MGSLRLGRARSGMWLSQGMTTRQCSIVIMSVIDGIAWLAIMYVMVAKPFN